MKLLHKTAALALALLCAVPVLTGCTQTAGGNQEIAEEDMPYGSTMRENKTSYAVPVTYDRRFLGEEEIAKAADLFGAIQNQDAALYAGTTFPFYEKYQREQVYQLDSPEALIEKLHSTIGNNTADDYHFSMVVFSDIATNPETGELYEVIAMLENAYDGEGKFMDTVQKSYDLTVDWSIRFNEDADVAMVSNQHVFLFQTADGWFALM